MSPSPLAAITGGTGFLGLHLVPALAQAGFRLRLLARRDLAHPAFKDIAFESVRGALEDEAALDALVRGADVVIHAAGLTKARGRAAFLGANRDGTEAVAHAARRGAPGARFLLVSSLAARAPRLSNYAFSKAEAEARTLRIYGNAAAQCAIIRPPAIYGPWDRDILPLIRASARALTPVLGNGRAAVIHARDAAGAIAALAGDKFRPGCFTLADDTPEGYEMRALMAAAAQATGGPGRFIHLPKALVLSAGFLAGVVGRPPIFTLGKARELLYPDWSVSPEELLPREIYTPRISLAAGFAETVAWYRQAGWMK